MARPLVGIIGNAYLMNDQYPTHTGGAMNSDAVANVANCLPVVIPTDPRYMSVEELIETFDGFVLTGARANVHPEEYGETATKAYGDFDRARDAIVLPLVRNCVELGLPFLGVCRGFQELNVAFGGTLHQRVHEIPGYLVHKENPDDPLDVQYGPSHKVDFTPGGLLADLTGLRRVTVNSLHSQAVNTVGEELEVVATAEDGLVEAFVIKGAPGFSLGVQWHPEWRVTESPVSMAIFAAFGDACRQYRLRDIG